MVMHDIPNGLGRKQVVIKRIFDFSVALLGLMTLWWLILLGFLIATIDTRQNGFFTQNRVGRGGRTFKVVKIRTMRKVQGLDTTVTTSMDARITKWGRILRRLKIDELPQLMNVLLGNMSFVGPRPDVPGYADKLTGEDRVILSIRPGITGPATLKYRDEEEILSSVEDPEAYNREVIFPDKVRINREYIKNYTLLSDIRYIIRTVVG